jgi:hypothetical protein
MRWLKTKELLHHEVAEAGAWRVSDDEVGDLFLRVEEVFGRSVS